VFIPALVCGASVGRLWGELMMAWFGNYFPTHQGKIFSGGFALAGAGAFAGGVTHTLSTATLLFEMSGQLRYLIATLYTTILSIGISRSYSFSMFDIVSRLKRHPLMPEPIRLQYGFTAVDVLSKEQHPLVYENCSLEELREISHQQPLFCYYPVITAVDQTFIGLVSRADIISSVNAPADVTTALPTPVPIHPISVTFQETTTLRDMHLILLSTHADRIFVTTLNGRLLGYVSQNVLKQALDICHKGAHSFTSINNRRTAWSSSLDIEKLQQLRRDTT